MLVGQDGTPSELVTVQDAYGAEWWGSIQELPQHLEAAWSPDGSRLAFGTGGSASTAIWVVGSDGSDPSQLAVRGNLIDWSPDGRSILVEEGTNLTYEGETRKHWIVEVDTDVVREVELPLSVTAWLPDGSFLGSRRGTGPDGFDRVIAVSPQAEETSYVAGFNPQLSPASDRIAVNWWGPGMVQPHLSLSNADGSEARDLGPGLSATWSPDGSRLAYFEPLADDPPILLGLERTQVVILSAAGERTHEFGFAPLQSARAIAWSPDGSYLAVSAADDDDRLWVIHVDTGETVEVAGAGYPAWRPGPAH